MKSNEEIKVWRFNLNTDKGIEKHIQTFDYCKEKEIIGADWQTQIRLMDCEQEKIDEILDKEKKEFSNPKGFKSAMKALKNMKPDHLIWTRRNNMYYLCRVTDCAKDFIEGDRESNIENSYNIWHYVPCEFVKIGTEENIIGSIIRSFNRGVVCHIKGRGSEFIVREFSKKIYNKYTGKDYYNVQKPISNWNYFFDCMSSLEIEELVGLYLQIKLGYGIYTSTNKKDTKEYEYILFKRDNPKEKAKLQVKASNIDLDEYNLGDMTFYFFASGNYLKNKKVLDQKQLSNLQSKEKIVIITKEDLIKFANEYQEMLPYKLNWFE